MFGAKFCESGCAAGHGSHQGIGRDHALDIGCSVGRSAFELATQFKAVDALDFRRDLFKWAL